MKDFFLEHADNFSVTDYINVWLRLKYPKLYQTFMDTPYNVLKAEILAAIEDYSVPAE